MGTGVAMTTASRVVVLEEVLVAGREAAAGVGAAVPVEHGLVAVADPGEPAALQAVEVAGEVRAPVVHAHHAEAYLACVTHQSFQTLPSAAGTTLRRSTTSCDSRATISQSTPEWAVTTTTTS